jgi:tetratricopeptide (TPR) repeat protein
VEGVLMSRFDRLADTTRRAAKAASVLDRPFGEPLFTALTGPDLAAELGPLVGAGILRRENPSGDYAFVHALTRQAIYTNLLPSQRADLHEHTAGVLEREPAPDVDRIAVHYEQSRNHAKAVAYLLLAGERALASFTSDAALSLLERGLARVDELPDPDRPHWRARFHARLGELLERMARHEPARTALHAALDEMDPDPLEAARIWRLVGQTHRLEGDDDSAHRAYDRAEELLAGVADVVTGRREWIRLQKERAMALYFGGRGDELPDHNARVAPVVERYGTAAQLADHLYGQMLSSFVSDHYISGFDRHQAVGGDREFFAFQVEVAERVRRPPLAEGVVGGLADHDGARFGDPFQASGHVDGVAHHVEAADAVAADVADQGRAGVDPDPEPGPGRVARRPDLRWMPAWPAPPGRPGRRGRAGGRGR